MQNPLVKYTNITVFDEKINDEITINTYSLSRYFKSVYCLCPFSIIDMDVIMAPIITQTKLEEMMDKLILYKAPIYLAKNAVHYGNLIHIDKEIIIKANRFDYDLEDKILILPIFNISFLNMQKYIDNIKVINTFDNLYDIIILNNYFCDSYTPKSIYKQKIISLITHLQESKYWTIKQNCNLNLTSLFEKREFNMHIIKNSTNEIKKIFEAVGNSPINGNYLDQIFNSKNYTDPSDIIKTSGPRVYSKVVSCNYTTDDINKMFDILDNKSQYFLFCNLCVSKEYCHLVINNKYLLQKLKPMIERYIYLFQYIMNYAWMRFYIEETINKFNIKTSDMYIFDIDTASSLPVFNFIYKDPYENPYFTLMVSSNVLQPLKNIISVDANIDINNMKTRGICNLEGFRQRLNIFISKDINIDLLKDIDFNKLNMAISGSVMTACCQENHPLLSLFKSNNSENNSENNLMTDLYNIYFDEYYYDSDIDVMFKSTNIFEFFDNAKEFYEQLNSNIQKIYSVDDTTTYNISRVSYLFVTPKFIKETICIQNDEYKYEYIIDNLHKTEIKQLFISFAKTMHEKYYMDLLKTHPDIIMDKYKNVFTFDPNNLQLKIKSNVNMGEIKREYDIKDNLYFNDTFKIKIISPALSHSFELFPVFKEDFMMTVSTFHLPCVRAYYNGNNVYMTPSCISAHMTYMNVDYKYFSSSTDPIAIINKYRMRGFGTWLNKKEIDIYIKYCHEVPFWQKIFNIENAKSIKECLGPLNINHRLFKPRLHCAEFIKPSIYNGNQYIITYNRKISTYMKYNIWYPNRSSHIRRITKKYNCISKLGNIKPLKNNIIQKIYTLYKVENPNYVKSDKDETDEENEDETEPNKEIDDEEEYVSDVEDADDDDTWS
jgi:hypothetical protein